MGPRDDPTPASAPVPPDISVDRGREPTETSAVASVRGGAEPPSQGAPSGERAPDETDPADEITPVVDTPVEADTRPTEDDDELAPGGAEILLRYETYAAVPRFTADGSCGLPGPPWSGRLPELGAPFVQSSTAWLGHSDLSAPALALRLAYTWSTYPCINVTLAAVLDVLDPRPDLRRFQKMARGGSEAAAALAWNVYITQGPGPVYQIPAEIPCDHTFAFSEAEVEYVDRAARTLFGTSNPSLMDLPLSSVKGLYVYPTPWPSSRALFDRVKAASTMLRSIMRLTRVGVCPSDWTSSRNRGHHGTRITQRSALAPGLVAGDFPSLPRDIRLSFPPLGCT